MWRGKAGGDETSQERIVRWATADCDGESIKGIGCSTSSTGSKPVSALAPIMEGGGGTPRSPEVFAGGLLVHVASRAPMLLHNSGCPETPYRSRSDFKTNRKAPPPLHANVSVLRCPLYAFRWYCEVLDEDGGLDGAGLVDGRSDDRACIRDLQRDGILTIHSPAGESATPVSQ